MVSATCLWHTSWRWGSKCGDKGRRVKEVLDTVPPIAHFHLCCASPNICLVLAATTLQLPLELGKRGSSSWVERNGREDRSCPFSTSHSISATVCLFLVPRNMKKFPPNPCTCSKSLTKSSTPWPALRMDADIQYHQSLGCSALQLKLSDLPTFLW